MSDLVCVVGEVDFMEDLGRFMLDGLHFHQMRRVLPGSISVKDDKKEQNWLEKKYFNTKYDGCVLGWKSEVLPQRFVQPLHAVSRQRVVLLGLEEALDVRQQHVTGRKQPSAQPQQLPAFLLTVPAATQHSPSASAQKN